MKISYKVLKSHLPNLPSPEEIAEKLIMHTAEVEEIAYEGENLKDVYIGEVVECEKHPDSEKLNLTKVNIGNKTIEVVCGAPNARKGIKVAAAIVGAKLAPDFTISKTKIRGAVSEGMLCSLDELGLIDERQEGIWEMPEDAPIGTSLRDYLDKTDAVLEVDNKAINHRPDMFSHIGVIRELATLYSLENNLSYEQRDFSNLEAFPLENQIPEVVERFSALKIENVENKETPNFIKQTISSAEVASKGLLVDITNYSLYFYGQPTHAYDADKVSGKIIVRYAKDGEKFTALNDEEYELTSKDIVIADEEKVLGLGGVIGGKETSVTAETKNVIIEAAHFDQAVVRQTGRRHGVRTDSLNVFEKDIPLDLQDKAQALISRILQEECENAKLVSFADSYPKKQEEITVENNLNFINNLIGKNYSEERVNEILTSLGFEFSGNQIKVPFWRTDVNYKADLAEEVARIDGYDNVEPSISSINSGAVIQDNVYKIKKDTASFFVDRGFFEMYNYSFTCKNITDRVNGDLNACVPLRNFLSEEQTHMRNSLIPGLLESLEQNIRDEKNLKLFELEKTYSLEGREVSEGYKVAGVITNPNDDVLYYQMQDILSDYFQKIGIHKFAYDKAEIAPSYAHGGRIAKVIIRGQEVGFVGEIHPNIAKRFDVNGRVAFFEIDVEKIKDSVYALIKAKEFSIFQENNFDLSFVVSKETKGREIHSAISSSDKKFIDRVDLIDIYENEEKMPEKRSLTFKIYISSLEGTLDDSYKGELIKNITQKVEKLGGELRA